MKYLLQVVLLFSLACQTEQNPIVISYDSALIPEGIAVDAKEEKLYLSSIHQSKIAVTDLKSNQSKDFISSGQNGYKTGVGMTVRNGKLFAIGSGMVNDSFSVLNVWDLKTKAFLYQFTYKDTLAQFMNDLAISQSNQIYITDTKRHRIYHLDYPDGKMQVFLESEELLYPNGIAISDDNTKLYVGSWMNGIRVIDIATKQILNDKNEATGQPGVDGLKFYSDKLYAMRGSGDPANHGLMEIGLSENNEVLSEPRYLLKNLEYFSTPTTIDIANNTVYVLANSQLGNLDQDKNEIIDPDKLTATYILKYKLE